MGIDFVGGPDYKLSLELNNSHYFRKMASKLVAGIFGYITRIFTDQSVTKKGPYIVGIIEKWMKEENLRFYETIFNKEAPIRIFESHTRLGERDEPVTQFLPVHLNQTRKYGLFDIVNKYIEANEKYVSVLGKDSIPLGSTGYLNSTGYMIFRRKFYEGSSFQNVFLTVLAMQEYIRYTLRCTWLSYQPIMAVLNKEILLINTDRPEDTTDYLLYFQQPEFESDKDKITEELGLVPDLSGLLAYKSTDIFEGHLISNVFELVVMIEILLENDSNSDIYKGKYSIDKVVTAKFEEKKIKEIWSYKMFNFLLYIQNVPRFSASPKKNIGLVADEMKGLLYVMGSEFTPLNEMVPLLNKPAAKFDPLLLHTRGTEPWGTSSRFGKSEMTWQVMSSLLSSRDTIWTNSYLLAVIGSFYLSNKWSFYGVLDIVISLLYATKQTYMGPYYSKENPQPIETIQSRGLAGASVLPFLYDNITKETNLGYYEPVQFLQREIERTDSPQHIRLVEITNQFLASISRTGKKRK